jgi:DNA-directed RNA polymerase specialized sigma24 family protein
MPSDGSVTRWIDQLPLGDGAAVRQLWQRYFQRLVGLARKKLADAPRGMADEEDVAMSVFDSLCRQAEQGRFPDLANRDGLWRLLVVMTVRKASHLRRDVTRLKRGGGQSTGAEDGETSDRRLEEILSREPDPATAALAADEHRRLMEVLGDDELRRVAQRRMEGDSVEEIAELFGYATRSIKRKLQLIRETWERELTT